MRKAIATFCLAALLGGTALAQGLPNPFDVGLGVRAEGFGGAYSALAQGTDALLYNPAGLALTVGLRADSAYASPMGLYSVTWIGGAMRGLGAGLAYLSAGGITDPEGDPLSFSHMALLAGGALPGDAVPYLGRFLPWPVFVGIGIKYDRVQVASEVGGNIALDFGAITSFDTAFGTLRMGLVISDLGPGIGLGERSEAWSTSASLGAALILPAGLILSADLAGGKFAVGLGWAFGGGLEVRGGFKSQGGMASFSLGLGVGWRNFVLDYAMTTHPVLGLSHRLALGITFGG